jgi:anthranilate/para-aminobenzoate synthase component I
MAGWSDFSAMTACVMSRKKLAACVKPDPIGAPDIQLMLSEDVVVFDNLKGELFLVTHADPAEAGAEGSC